jgi:hypothetical protein
MKRFIAGLLALWLGFTPLATLAADKTPLTNYGGGILGIKSGDTIPCAVHPALTGDVTLTAGTCTTAIGAHTVVLGDIAQIGANKVLGNATGSTANVTALTMPSCSAASSALTWTSASGFGCNTITAGSGTVTTTGSPASGNIAKFSGSTSITAAVSGTDYQAPITLTTTGTSGAATLTGATLNIPQYSGGGGSGGGGLYDISAGVPASGSLTQVGDTTHHTLTQRGTTALNVKITSNPGAVRELTGWKMAAPGSTPYQVAVLALPNMSNGNYYGVSVGFYNSVNGKYRVFTILSNYPTITPAIETWTAFNSRSSSTNGAGFFFTGQPWFHVGYDGTNITYGVSIDGATPFGYISEAAATNLGGAPTDVFFGMVSNPLEGSYIAGQNVSFLVVDPAGLSRHIGP